MMIMNITKYNIKIENLICIKQILSLLKKVNQGNTHMKYIKFIMMMRMMKNDEVNKVI